MTVLLVDGNHSLHRCMKTPALADLKNRYDKPTGGIFGFIKSLRSAMYAHRISECYVVFDGGISKRRRELLPEYKGSRHRNPGDLLYEEPDDDKKEYIRSFRRQRGIAQVLLPLLGCNVVVLDGWEADDLIGCLTKWINNKNIIIMSDDSDMFQFLSGSAFDDDVNMTSVYRPNKGDLLSVDNFEHVIKYPLEQLLIRKSILGDPGSDNIAGVAGVGPKTVDKVFAEMQSYDYPFGDLFIYCDGHRDRRIRLIADNIDIVMRNYELVCINLELQQPAAEMELESINEVLGQSVDVDITGAKKILNELDLFSLTKDFHQWVIPFQRLL